LNINRRKIDTEVARKLKEDYKLDLFFEASAKSGINVNNVHL
jgi:hypothetical protein